MEFNNNPYTSNPIEPDKAYQTDVDKQRTNSKLYDDIHVQSDVDNSYMSKHHTLGTGKGQASPGTHIHDGTTSRKIGYGLGLTITGSRGGNAAVASIIALLGTVIDFTDGTTP